MSSGRGGDEIQLRLQKYVPELTFMLQEFEKLESQLLAGNTARQQKQKSTFDTQQNSRREKLRSFILHITDVISQLKKIAGTSKSSLDEVSASGKSSSSKASEVDVDDDKAGAAAELEQHILTSLLPVKDRLKKQLMNNAQSNDTGGSGAGTGDARKVPISGGTGGTTGRPMGTFAAAAAKKQQANGSVFGKPLSGGGSSLTQKLHGRTLGSAERRYGAGVGHKKDSADVGDGDQTKQRQVLYAGITSRIVGNNGVGISSEGEVVKRSKSMDESETSLKISKAPSGVASIPSIKQECIGEVVMPPPPPSASIMAAAAIRKKAAVAAAAARTAAIVTKKYININNINNIKKNVTLKKEERSVELVHAQVELSMGNDSNSSVKKELEKSGTTIASYVVDKKIVNDPTNTISAKISLPIEKGPITKGNNISITNSKQKSVEASKKVLSQNTKPEACTSANKNVVISSKACAKNSLATIQRKTEQSDTPQYHQQVKCQETDSPDNDSKDKPSKNHPLHPAQELVNEKGKLSTTVSSFATSPSTSAPKHLDESTVVFLPSKSSSGSSKNRKRCRPFGTHSGSMDHSGISGGGSYKKNAGSSHAHHSSQIRSVEYICAMCNETYRSECKIGNPWWALTQEPCLKCSKSQVGLHICRYSCFIYCVTICFFL